MSNFYLAAKNGTGFEVRTLEEMEQQLAEGYTIIEASGDTEKVLATPDKGWIKPKPTPSNSKVCKSKAATDENLAAALNILVYGEAADYGNADAGA